jgi:hypothetical protein
VADNKVQQAIRTLANEEPRSLMARVRALLPDIEAAIAVGHTMTTVHQRLNLAGMQISYDVLRIYRRRLQRARQNGSVKTQAPRLASDSKPSPVDSRSEGLSKNFDPLENFRKQIANRPNWEYPSGPLDEKKLI